MFSPRLPRRTRQVAAGSTLASRRRHPLAAGLLIAVGLTVMGGLYAALTSTGAASASSSDGDPQQIAKGRSLFLEGCSSCHGLNAQGTTVQTSDGTAIQGPTLIGVGAAAVDFQVGTGRMPLAKPGVQATRGRVIYTQEEIDQLAAYVASLAPGPAIPTDEQLNTFQASLQNGGELFRTNCAQCHNFDGKGGALSDGTRAPSVHEATPRQIWEAMLTGPESMPVFSDNTITPDQKRDIVRFIDNLKTQPNPGGMALGSVGPVSEGLFLWLVGIGAVTAVAVWIGVKSS